MHNWSIPGLLLIITTGRLTSIAIGILGLISLVIGRQALARSNASMRPRRPKAIATLIIGLTVVALSVLHLSLSTGGIGTGSGKLGSIVAMLIGLTGSGLGCLALVRSRRMAK
ncbi:MAG TPA: DUF6223 family protein [Niastella sp.]